MENTYNEDVEKFREEEYPMLKDALYLDHAGSTLYSKSLMERFMGDMMSNLYGNPHSVAPSSQISTNRIEDTRLNVLRFFKADPQHFDIVFVANATAGMKLVMDSFRERNGGFRYGYHEDAHTSLVGIRENAIASRCLNDEEVEAWLSGGESLVEEKADGSVELFAFPAQSNMNGRRLPLSWSGKVREKGRYSNTTAYTLLDAAAFVSTAQLDLSDVTAAPDFTVLSFYKIFGFPDLGALIVRKDSAAVLQRRKYFGGGTVDVVLCIKEQWHAPKTQSLHEALEDGTLPFHSILALDSAIDVHRKLYGSMDKIANHTSYLAQKLYNGLASLRHRNLQPVCTMYSDEFTSKNDGQGPVVAFNLKTIHGAWVSNIEFTKLASVKKIHIRSGGLCNPGGVSASLKLEPWEVRRNFSAGMKCGGESDIYAGKITGIIRASLGAMSTVRDVETFVSFVREFYAETRITENISIAKPLQLKESLFVESLSIYPIKSCGGMKIPPRIEWEIRPEGLAWDREWCLLHEGTGQALNQKRHPRMALIRSQLDFQSGFLRVRYHGAESLEMVEELLVPLSANPALYKSLYENNNSLTSRVCGDKIVAHIYACPEMARFFSAVLEVPCVLARFPAGGSGLSSRHSKAHLQKHQRVLKATSSTGDLIPGAYPEPLTPPDSDTENQNRPILLSNESPILTINRASLDALNKEIKRHGGKCASASVFRANVVLASLDVEHQRPYAEDHWTNLRIGEQNFRMLGSCRRCHMICVDQNTAERDEEPFVTLAKTRRFESKIFFGSHMCHIPLKSGTKESQYPTIKVGDTVSIDTEEE